jgi:hypothetical protein
MVNGMKRLKMKAKITYMYGNWEFYFVNSCEECRDSMDCSSYKEFLKSGGQTITMGKVLIERG